jgi:imidazolonepropionase-like amidohydrolase
MNIQFTKSTQSLLAALLCLLPGVVFADDFVITNASVFDGERLLPPTNVIVRDGLISSIDAEADTRGLDQVDGTGATVLPGLLNAHAHTEDAEQLRESLRFGVTTVFDVGTFPPNGPILREAAATRVDVADFRSSGIMAAAPGGHGTEFGIDIPTVANPDEAAGFVRGRLDENADYLKIVINGVRNKRDGMPTLEPDTVNALTRSAHESGLMVLAHIESVEDVELAVSAGVDGLVHHWRDSGAQPELSRLLASNNIFVMPTPTAPDGLMGVGPKALMNDDLISPYLSDLSREQLTKELDVPPGITMDENFAGIRSLSEAGVLLLAGSDAFTGNPRIVHGASMHRLLELFVAAGVSEVATLRSATANVADAFELTDRGRIKPGLRADLVLVRGDPTTDIMVTRDILGVWRQGNEVNRQP